MKKKREDAVAGNLSGASQRGGGGVGGKSRRFGGTSGCGTGHHAKMTTIMTICVG